MFSAVCSDFVFTLQFDLGSGRQVEIDFHGRLCASAEAEQRVHQTRCDADGWIWCALKQRPLHVLWGRIAAPCTVGLNAVQIVGWLSCIKLQCIAVATALHISISYN